MSDSRRSLAAIRLAGRPDLLFVDGATSDLGLGDRVTVETTAGPMDAQVVIALGQFAGDFGVLQSGLAGTLDRRGDRLVVTLAEERIPPMARKIGAAGGGKPPNDGASSIGVLYREFGLPALRLGRRVDTDGVQGVVVALDRESGVAVVELASGETRELDIRSLG